MALLEASQAKSANDVTEAGPSHNKPPPKKGKIENILEQKYIDVIQLIEKIL